MRGCFSPSGESFATARSLWDLALKSKRSFSNLSCSSVYSAEDIFSKNKTKAKTKTKKKLVFCDKHNSVYVYLCMYMRFVFLLGLQSGEAASHLVGWLSADHSDGLQLCQGSRPNVASPGCQCFIPSFLSAIATL